MTTEHPDYAFLCQHCGAANACHRCNHENLGHSCLKCGRGGAEDDIIASTIREHEARMRAADRADMLAALGRRRTPPAPPVDHVCGPECEEARAFRDSSAPASLSILDLQKCSLCGGEIGPDVTGRPMCYGCGPSGMRPKRRCPDHPTVRIGVMIDGKYCCQFPDCRFFNGATELELSIAYRAAADKPKDPPKAVNHPCSERCAADGHPGLDKGVSPAPFFTSGPYPARIPDRLLTPEEKARLDAEKRANPFLRLEPGEVWTSPPFPLPPSRKWFGLSPRMAEPEKPSEVFCAVCGVKALPGRSLVPDGWMCIDFPVPTPQREEEITLCPADGRKVAQFVASLKKTTTTAQRYPPVDEEDLL